MNNDQSLQIAFDQWFAKEYPITTGSITDQVMNRVLKEVAEKAFYHGAVIGINLMTQKEV